MNESARPQQREYTCRSLFRAAALVALGGIYLRLQHHGENMTDFIFADPAGRLCALDWELRNGVPPLLPFRAFSAGYHHLRAEHRALHDVIATNTAAPTAGRVGG